MDGGGVAALPEQGVDPPRGMADPVIYSFMYFEYSHVLTLATWMGSHARFEGRRREILLVSWSAVATPLYFFLPPNNSRRVAGDGTDASREREGPLGLRGLQHEECVGCPGVP